MEVKAVHVPVRPGPEVSKRGRGIWPLIERYALLTVLARRAEHVLVTCPGRPSKSSAESIVGRLGLIEAIRHRDVGQRGVLAYLEVDRQRQKIDLQSVG